MAMPALFILRYKKLFLFAEAFKNTRKFKISIERINLHLTFITFKFVEITLFNAFFWEKKAGFGKLMKNVRDAGLCEEYRFRNPSFPDPDSNNSVGNSVENPTLL